MRFLSCPPCLQEKEPGITASFIILPVIVWHYIIHPLLLTLWYQAFALNASSRAVLCCAVRVGSGVTAPRCTGKLVEFFC